MKIFVSYARADKAYCIRIIETLRAHDVWYDQRLYAGQEWWKEILRRLEWCEAFLYLLSPDSLTSQYCRRELELALRLKRDIIPVMITKDTALPENMRDRQVVDLSDKLTVENVSQLLNAILMVERQKMTEPTPAAELEAPDKQSGATANGAEAISLAVRALEKGEYRQAARLLRQAKASGYQSRFVKIDKLLRVAESALKERKQTRKVEREYQHIVALFAFESTRQMACEALEDFRREFGDYDPRGLRELCEPAAPEDQVSSRPGSTNNLHPPPTPPPNPTPSEAPPPAASPRPTARASSQTVPDRPPRGDAARPALVSLPQTENPRRLPDADAPLTVKEVLPMLQWCDIPYGTVTVSSIVGADEDFGEMTVQLDNFVMSKYPVTNAQFAIFARAEDGYKNSRWWTFSEHAQRWFKQAKGLAEARFSGEEHPRENVNWYEAMAFANWLGSLLKMKVALPTVAQWQRAAQGDDDRYFPWGDEYNEEHCNTLETGLKMTTPVNRYHQGVSPYGVYDMAGNIWEWTLNTAVAADEGRDHRRAVAGGSFVSPCDRAQTSFRYYLDPRVRYSSIGIRLVGLT